MWTMCGGAIRLLSTITTNSFLSRFVGGGGGGNDPRVAGLLGATMCVLAALPQKPAATVLRSGGFRNRGHLVGALRTRESYYLGSMFGAPLVS